MKITSVQRDLLIAHLSTHMDNLIQEKYVGLTSYHHGHERQFEFAREKDNEIQEVKKLIDELTWLIE